MLFALILLAFAAILLVVGVGVYVAVVFIKHKRIAAARVASAPAAQSPRAALPEAPVIARKLAVGCLAGDHPRVLEGGGMMEDALTCVDCGRHKYPEVFGTAQAKRKRPVGPDGTYLPVKTAQERDYAWSIAK